MPKDVLSVRSEAFLLSSAGDSERVLTFHDEVRSQVGGKGDCLSKQTGYLWGFFFPSQTRSVTESGVKVASFDFPERASRISQQLLWWFSSIKIFPGRRLATSAKPQLSHFSLQPYITSLWVKDGCGGDKEIDVKNSSNFKHPLTQLVWRDVNKLLFVKW